MIRKTNGSAPTANLMRAVPLIGAALCILLALWVARAADDPLTRAAQTYSADIATKAAGTYVVLRTLNAVLSTAQEVEVGVSFIASGNAQPLKVLEPLDDTIERIAALVFGVTVATGVLAVALGPVSAVGLTLLAIALLIAGLSRRRVMARRLGWYGAFLGLALPIGLTLAAPLAEVLTAATLARNQALVAEITQSVGETDLQAPEEIADLGLNDYRKITANVWQRADELIGALVAIFGVYLFRILILPVMLILGMFFAARSLARGAPG
ncbi:hypothetical protein AB2B41_16005 [Marimonas sp. MJW-29]|uniref:Uncharacterized protein n=1 Tax=Sulfitobacter sediminis TaxID=3234186 RepID=A0ABV3RSU0_9RHOB